AAGNPAAGSLFLWIRQPVCAYYAGKEVLHNMRVRYRIMNVGNGKAFIGRRHMALPERKVKKPVYLIEESRASEFKKKTIPEQDRERFIKESKTIFDLSIKEMPK
ncbi:MAG TPA: hypothetical protein PKW41_12285, partial [Clostridia bacterium]|nr:hypothetical protein [Clostridia bacterium]